MDTVLTERRSRKRIHNKLRSASSDNLDRSVSRGSLRRQKSKRRRRQSPKRMESIERRDSRRKSKKRARSKRSRSRTARTRNVPEQTNSTSSREPMQLREIARQKTNASSHSQSIPICAAVPSTSSAHPTESFVQVNTSTAIKPKTASTCNAVAPTVPDGTASDSKNTMSINESNALRQSGSSQLLNKKSKCHVDKTKTRSPSLEEHSESELQCSICSELFIKATMLNCIHTFCKYCIDMWKRNKAECPLCRTSITSECRITKFDLMIETISGKTAESLKQRMEVLKEREELEVNSSSQETHSSAQQRLLRTPNVEIAVQLWGVSNSSDEAEESVRDDNEDYDDDSASNDNMVFTDVDSEYGLDDYGFLTNSEEDNNVGSGDEDSSTTQITDIDDNADQDNEVYVIDDDYDSDGNGAIAEAESVDNNDNESINSDENVVYESSNENDNGDGDSDDDAAYEEVADSSDSDENADHEADDNDEDDSENDYEEDNSSHGTDNNMDDDDHDAHDYNENDETGYHDGDNNDNSVDAHEYASDNNSVEAQEYTSDNNSIESQEYASDNNSNDVYSVSNEESNNDVSYDDDGDYDFD